MASPQLKNGYTRIANELLNEIMKVNLNGTQFRLVLAIWRYTYGFKRKSHPMSVTYLAELINTSRSAVDRELNALIERNMVKIVEVNERGTRVLSVNKNHKEWGKQETTPSPIQDKPIKTNKKPKYSEDNSYYKMAVYFYKLVEKVGQEAGLTHLTKKANLQTWADDMRKLIELDKVDKHLAKEVMDWVVQDDFWKTNILSASKLRKQFPQLAIKMSAQKQQSKPKPVKDHRDKEIALQQWIAEGNDPDEFNWNA